MKVKSKRDIAQQIARLEAMLNAGRLNTKTAGYTLGAQHALQWAGGFLDIEPEKMADFSLAIAKKIGRGSPTP